MIKLMRGLLVGLGLGFALFHASDQSLEIYMTSLALMVLVGLLIPLEQQDRRLDHLTGLMTDLYARQQRIEERLGALQGVIEARFDSLGSTMKAHLEGIEAQLEAEDEEDEEEEPTPRFEIREDPRYIPAVQPGINEGRPMMAHGRRTVERSVEDVARKLASMQRGS